MSNAKHTVRVLTGAPERKGVLQRWLQALQWLLIVALLPTSNACAEAVLASERRELGPVPVKVGIILDQIVEINQKAENFTAVLTLQASWHEPALAYQREDNDPPFRSFSLNSFVARLETEELSFPNVVFENMQGRLAVNTQLINLFPDGTILFYERSTATFQAPDFDFREYPFDTQDFYIRVMLLEPENLFFLIEAPGTSSIGERLGEEEWIVGKSTVMIDSVAGPDGVDRSRFSLGFSAHRHKLYYVVRVFIPMLIILLVSWFTFRLNDYVKRIDIGFTALLLFIAFNFTLGSDLPRLGYLTAVDVIIAGTFLITGLVILVNVQLRLLQLRGEDAAAARLDRIAFYGYWPAYILGLSAALILI